MEHSWLHALQSAVLAPHCALCHARATPEIDLCAACRAELPWQAYGCTYCGLTLAGTTTTTACRDCLQQPRFDGAIATFEYLPPADWLITRLKFHRRFTHARLLGTLMAARIAGASAPAPDYIVPVPLHARRYRERGYNQAEMLARQLARKLELPVRGDLARRRRHTSPQLSLPATERKRNVRNAFAVRADCSGDDIAIVDDVVTTGHTAAALATALKRNGAARVRLWCAARA